MPVMDKSGTSMYPDQRNCVWVSIRRMSEVCGRWIGAAAWVCLGLSAVVFVLMWVRAFLDGTVPKTAWGEVAGNHGPWRGLPYPLGPRYALRDMWYQVLDLQCLAALCASVSLLLRPRWHTALVAVGAAAAGFLFLFTHYWLVD
jgi:hypothetical protein